MTSTPLHIGDRVIIADQRVGILRSICISHTDTTVSVEIELRHVLDFDRPIGFVQGHPDELEVRPL